MSTYRLTYDASSNGDGSQIVVWEKTLAELLAPNGEDSLLVWMLKETEERGGPLKLERITERSFPAYEEEEATLQAIAEAAEAEGEYIQHKGFEGAFLLDGYALVGMRAEYDAHRHYVVYVASEVAPVRARLKVERENWAELTLFYCSPDGQLDEVG